MKYFTKHYCPKCDANRTEFELFKETGVPICPKCKAPLKKKRFRNYGK